MTIYKVLVRDADGTTRLVSKHGYRSAAEHDFNIVRLALLAARPTSSPLFVEQHEQKPELQSAC